MISGIKYRILVRNTFHINDWLSLDLLGALVVALVALSSSSAMANENYNGYFLGDPEGKLVGKRWFELSKDFEYHDPSGVTWRVSAPFRTDGASIPRLFWTIFGNPMGGNYRYAAIIHDYFCQKRYPEWEAVHKMFYEGMRAKGVSEARALTMYLTVYRFGPRWKTEKSGPLECQIGRPEFRLDRCIRNDAGLSGEPLEPLQELNRENLNKFISDVRSKGFSEEADELQASPEIQKILQ